MKNFNIKTISIYLLLIIYIVFTDTIGYKDFTNIFNYIINPIFWLILFVISFYINKEYIQITKFKSIKLQTIFIIVLTYLIVYFSLGLFIGYAKNVYNNSIIGIIKNTYVYIIPIIFMEYTRTAVTNSNKKLYNYIIITILFTLASINIQSIFTNSSYSTIFKNLSSIAIPSVTSNILLTYLSINCNYYGNLFYRLPLQITNIILPIIPNLDWYYTAILGILLPLITYIFIKNIDDKINNYESKRRLKKKSTIKMIYIIIPLLICICFVAGIFKYKPTAILSDSMKPIYSRGDVVVVEKLSKKELNKLKKYDIIEYILDGTIVAHRIINIEKHPDGTILITTKGDNNNAADTKKVKAEQIIGRIKFSVAKVGYPSVYLNEFFNKERKAKVATGDK